MEKQLQKVAEDALKKDGVIGFVCADDRGLPLAVSGVGEKAICSTLHRVMTKASKLEIPDGNKVGGGVGVGNNDSSRHPVVLGIDTDRGRIYVKRHNNITTAVYMKY